MSFSPTSFLLHLTSLTFMWKGYRYGTNAFPQMEWVASSKCGLSQFLTIQSIIASMLTMALALLADLTQSSPVQRLQRLLLAITLPVSWVVTIIYWTLLLFLPSLILPSPEVDIDTSIHADPNAQVLSGSTRLPLTHDMLLHVLPALSLTLEFVFFQKPYPARVLASSALLTHLVAGVYYATYVEYCSFETKQFPYPFLTIAPLYIRILIYAGAILLSIASLRLCNRLHPLSGRKKQT